MRKYKHREVKPLESFQNMITLNIFWFSEKIFFFVSFPQSAKCVGSAKVDARQHFTYFKNCVALYANIV